MKEYIMIKETGNAPITVAELIRCKDCKWHAGRYCNNFNVMGFENDDYCSMAYRREEE